MFKKEYKNKEEREERKKIFLQNEDQVNQKHEDFLSGKSHWDASMHDFDDLTSEELQQKFGVHDMPQLSSTRSFQVRSSITPSSIASRNIPDEWSWVEQGGVAPVMSQVDNFQFSSTLPPLIATLMCIFRVAVEVVLLLLLLVLLSLVCGKHLMVLRL